MISFTVTVIPSAVSEDVNRKFEFETDSFGVSRQCFVGFCVAHTVDDSPLVWVVAALNIMLGFQQLLDFRLIGNERSCDLFLKARIFEHFGAAVSLYSVFSSLFGRFGTFQLVFPVFAIG